MNDASLLIASQSIRNACAKSGHFRRFRGCLFVFLKRKMGSEWCQNGVTRGKVWFYFWLFVKSGGKKIFDTVVNHCSQLCFLFLSRGYQDSIPKVLEISISISISFNYFNLIVCSFRKPI